MKRSNRAWYYGSVASEVPWLYEKIVKSSGFRWSVSGGWKVEANQKIRALNYTYLGTEVKTGKTKSLVWFGLVLGFGVKSA